MHFILTRTSPSILIVRHEGMSRKLYVRNVYNKLSLCASLINIYIEGHIINLMLYCVTVRFNNL